MRKLAAMVDRYPPNAEISLLVLCLAAHLIMQALRKDILTGLSKERTRLQELNGGDEPCAELDQPSLEEALMVEDLYCIGMQNRQPPQTLAWILSALFGDLDQKKPAKSHRFHFHRFAYRALAWEARRIVNAEHFVQPSDEPVFPRLFDRGASTPSTWFEGFLWAVCVREHRILPYLTPGQKRLTPEADNGRRQWFPITGSFDSNAQPSDKAGNCIVDACAKPRPAPTRYYFRSTANTDNDPLDVYHCDSYTSSSSKTQVRELKIRICNTFGTGNEESPENETETEDGSSRKRRRVERARVREVLFVDLIQADGDLGEDDILTIHDDDDE